MKVNIVALLQNRIKVAKRSEDQKVERIIKSPSVELVNLKGCVIDQAYQEAGLLHVSSDMPKNSIILFSDNEGNFVAVEFVIADGRWKEPSKEAMVEHAEGSAYGNAN